MTMRTKIRDGAANWQLAQVKTFTKWVNHHLETGGFEPVTDLFTAFQSGVALVHLLQQLSGKPFSKYVKNPTMRVQKLENLAICLDFIHKEGIKTSNMGAEDIASGNEKIIMGLVWHLIRHYILAAGITDENDSNDSSVGNGADDKQQLAPVGIVGKLAAEEQNSSKGGGLGGSPKGGKRGSRTGEAKATLLEWVRNKTAQYGVEVHNFSSSFGDGRAFVALTAATDRSFDFAENSKGTPQDRMERSFEHAHKVFGVPKLLSHEDFEEGNQVDEKSVVTYIATAYKNSVLFEEKNKIENDLLLAQQKKDGKIFVAHGNAATGAREINKPDEPVQKYTRLTDGLTMEEEEGEEEVGRVKKGKGNQAGQNGDGKVVIGAAVVGAPVVIVAPAEGDEVVQKNILIYEAPLEEFEEYEGDDGKIYRTKVNVTGTNRKGPGYDVDVEFAKKQQKEQEEIKAKAEADKIAKEEAERRAEAERKAKEEAERRAEAERKAKEDAEKRAREEAQKREQLEREKAETEARLVKEKLERDARVAKDLEEKEAWLRDKMKWEAEKEAFEAEKEAFERAKREASDAGSANRGIDNGDQLAKEKAERDKLNAEKNAFLKQKQDWEKQKKANDEREEKEALLKEKADREARERATAHSNSDDFTIGDDLLHFDLSGPGLTKGFAAEDNKFMITVKSRDEKPLGFLPKGHIVVKIVPEDFSADTTVTVIPVARNKHESPRNNNSSYTETDESSDSWIKPTTLIIPTGISAPRTTNTSSVPPKSEKTLPYLFLSGFGKDPSELDDVENQPHQFIVSYNPSAVGKYEIRVYFRGVCVNPRKITVPVGVRGLGTGNEVQVPDKKKEEIIAEPKDRSLDIAGSTLDSKGSYTGSRNSRRKKKKRQNKKGSTNSRDLQDASQVDDSELMRDDSKDTDSYITTIPASTPIPPITPEEPKPRDLDTQHSEETKITTTTATNTNTTTTTNTTTNTTTSTTSTTTTTTSQANDGTGSQVGDHKRRSGMFARFKKDSHPSLPTIPIPETYVSSQPSGSTSPTSPKGMVDPGMLSILVDYPMKKLYQDESMHITITIKDPDGNRVDEKCRIHAVINGAHNKQLTKEAIKVGNQVGVYQIPWGPFNHDDRGKWKSMIFYNGQRVQHKYTTLTVYPPSTRKKIKNAVTPFVPLPQVTIDLEEKKVDVGLTTVKKKNEKKKEKEALRNSGLTS